jgi:hypothetical protein
MGEWNSNITKFDVIRVSLFHFLFFLSTFTIHYFYYAYYCYNGPGQKSLTIVLPLSNIPFPQGCQQLTLLYTNLHALLHEEILPGKAASKCTAAFDLWGSFIHGIRFCVLCFKDIQLEEFQF